MLALAGSELVPAHLHELGITPPAAVDVPSGTKEPVGKSDGCLEDRQSRSEVALWLRQVWQTRSGTEIGHLALISPLHPTSVTSGKLVMA